MGVASGAGLGGGMYQVRFHLTPISRSVTTEVENEVQVAEALGYVLKHNVNLQACEIQMFQQSDGSVDIRFREQQREGGVNGGRCEFVSQKHGAITEVGGGRAEAV